MTALPDPVLVTGAAGLLGAAVVRLLVERGHQVVALVRDRDPRSPFYADRLVDRCVEVRAELTDADRLLAEHAPATVLHLAAQSQVPVANRDPLSTWESNVRGTWLLLEACRRAARPPHAVVVASSDKAYGLTPPPYTEDAPLAPVDPYDVSKACADLIARSYASRYGLPVVVTRCGNLYGPGDLHLDRLVPGTCALLARGQAPVLRSTGRMTREWLYVDDAARAVLLLAGRAADLAGQAVNVGGGEVASVRDVVDRVRSLAALNLTPIVAAADPPGEIPHQRLDSTRLRSLGWVPQVTLDEGLALTWAWHRHLAV